MLCNLERFICPKWSKLHRFYPYKTVKNLPKPLPVVDYITINLLCLTDQQTPYFNLFSPFKNGKNGILSFMLQEIQTMATCGSFNYLMRWRK